MTMRGTDITRLINMADKRDEIECSKMNDYSQTTVAPCGI